MMGSQALVDLLDAFLCLSLLHQRPATQENPTRPQLRKPLCRSEIDGSVGAGLRVMYLAAELMEQRRKAQGKTSTKGVCTLVCQSQRVVDLCQPLRRIPQMPQRPGVINPTHDASVLPIEQRRLEGLLGVVERYTLGKTRLRLGDDA